MFKTKFAQRMIGFLLLAGAAIVTMQEWHSALTTGIYHPKASALFPAFGIIGIGMLLFPLDYDRLRAEHRVERVRSWEQMPTAWRVLSVIAFIAALGNWWLIANF